MAASELDLESAGPVVLEASEYEQATRALAEGGFHQNLLREELSLLKRRSAEVQAALGSSEQPAPQDKGVLAAMFSAGREAEEARRTGRSTAHVLRAQKLELDRLIDDLKRRIHKLDMDQKSAEEKLALQKLKSGSLRPEQRLLVKQAVLGLAEKVNLQATRCAEALGRLWLRTPACLLHLSVFGEESAAAAMGAQPQELFPKLDLDPDALDSWKIFEHIDELAKGAMRQEESAVLQLMSLLESGDVRAEAQEHLVRVVLDTMAGVERHDRIRIERTRRTCPLTANWPKGDAEASNAEAYHVIQRASEAWMDEFASPSQAALPPSPAGANAAQRSLQMPAKPVDRFTRLWQFIEDAFSDLMRKDPLLHITPHVVDLLMQVSQRGIVRLKEQELVLYGLPGSHRQEPHWFTRRQAANKVCDLAFAGNMLACDLVLRRLLKDDHWVVRHAVINEVLRMRSHLDAEEPYLRELVETAEDALRSLPASCQPALPPQASASPGLR